MDITEKILYKGIVMTMNSKSVLVKQCLKYEAIRKELAEKILEEGTFREKISVKMSPIKGGVSAEIPESYLDKVFDELIGKKIVNIKGIKGDKAIVLKEYMDVLKDNGKEISLDTTYMITYGILKTEACVKAFYEELQSQNLYEIVMEEFERSEDKSLDFEECLDAKEVKVSRMIRGLLYLFRREKSANLYETIMRVIYAGYQKQKNRIRKKRILDMDLIREMQKDVFQDNGKSVLLAACEEMVFCVIAEDLGIEINWEFEMLVLLDFVQQFASELSGEEAERIEIPSKMNAQQKEIVNKVIEKYSTHKSTEQLFYGEKQSDFVYLINILKAFHVSPRKWYAYSLDTKEILTLLAQKENWKSADYIYCMLIAIMCKYIYSLENIVSNVDVYKLEKESKEIREGTNHIVAQQKAIEVQKSQLEKKEQELDKKIIILQKELEKSRAEVVDLREEMQIKEIELTELRSYVYALKGNQTEEEQVEAKEQLEYLNSMKILVLGGHSNWQRKLKEIFPQWSFVASSNKTFPIELLCDKDYIVCNTEVLSHATYYKMLAGRSKNQRILYVRSNNMELCLREIYMQLKVS